MAVESSSQNTLTSREECRGGHPRITTETVESEHVIVAGLNRIMLMRTTSKHQHRIPSQQVRTVEGTRWRSAVVPEAWNVRKLHVAARLRKWRHNALSELEWHDVIGESWVVASGVNRACEHVDRIGGRVVSWRMADPCKQVSIAISNAYILPLRVTWCQSDIDSKHVTLRLSWLAGASNDVQMWGIHCRQCVSENRKWSDVTRDSHLQPILGDSVKHPQLVAACSVRQLSTKNKQPLANHSRRVAPPGEWPRNAGYYFTPHACSKIILPQIVEKVV